MTYYLTICNRLGSTVLPLKTIAHHQRLPTTTHYYYTVSNMYICDWKLKSNSNCHCFKLPARLHYVLCCTKSIYMYIQYTPLFQKQLIRESKPIRPLCPSETPASQVAPGNRSTGSNNTIWVVCRRQATRLLHSTILGFKAGTRCVTSSLPYILMNQCIDYDNCNVKTP